jgi:hypothetical protein
MTAVAEQQVPISGRWEAEVGVVKLSKCASCGSPHPLASNYWKQAFEDNEHCPNCGEPVAAPGREQLASAYVNLPWPARILHGIGRGLHWLARKVEP